MTDIPKDLRNYLEQNCYLSKAEIYRKYKSNIDETVKYVFKMFDGELIESVLMKYEHGYSICISTQIGCRMGCKFCASGLNGLNRSLTASEMLAQIITASKDNNIRISNVVMMGMGEPLDNFENSSRFLKLVCEPDGLGIGLRHISLSTSGVVPGILKLKKLDLPITLSVSLHAPFDELRKEIMPVARKWSISELLCACKEYQQKTTRRISFEYALIKGVNDSKECAEELCRILKGIMCHINLIPANPVKENSFEKPDTKNIKNFKSLLESKGMNVTVRRTLGADISASCGQLRKKVKEDENLDNLR